MYKFFLLTFLWFTQAAHSQIAISDPVAMIQDETKRAALLKKQMDEIQRRLDLPNPSCGELLAPLPGENDVVHFARATAALDKMKLVLILPSECSNLLLQNLAILPPTPTVTALIKELTSLNTSFFFVLPNTRVCEQPQADFNGLLKLEKRIKKINACSDLKPGQWKRVTGKSLWGSNLDYTLQRTKTGELKVFLNLKFEQDAATGSGVSNEMMMNRARSCMQTVSQFIKGPGGEAMTFNLLTPLEANLLDTDLRPTPQTVKINYSSNFRANSENYNHDVDCPTIAHEMMHLLGLVDEYPGESDGSICRPVPQEMTLMNGPAAFNATVPRTLSCSCESKDCQDAINTPGRSEFLLAPRFYQVSSNRFRNKYCQPAYSNNVVAWDQKNLQPPFPPSSSTLSSDGLKLKVIDSYFGSNWKDIFPATTECSCPSYNDECKNKLKELSERKNEPPVFYCPWGLKNKDFIWGRASETKITGDSITFGVTPVAGPLLHPTHVKRILSGTCSSKSTTYNTCAKFTYCKTIDQCKGIPAKCLKPNYLNE